MNVPAPNQNPIQAFNPSEARRRFSLHTAGLLPWLLASLAAPTPAARAQSAARLEANLASCNATTSHDVLHASTAAKAPAATEARAYWLNRKLLQWPGLALDGGKTGTFKLVASSTGALRAEVGQTVAGADLTLPLRELAPNTGVSAALRQRFKFISPGPVLTLPSLSPAQHQALHQQQLTVVQLDAQGRVLRSTAAQHPGALDDLYASAQREPDLGATATPRATRYKLWAPTAQRVWVCEHANSTAPATRLTPLERSPHTGVWKATTQQAADASAPTTYLPYYRYLVQVFVPGVGLVLNRVTDPYSLSLGADSQLSLAVDLDSAELMPPGWQNSSAPPRALANTDVVIYELGLRDFSAHDDTVPPHQRGRYQAFTQSNSQGMQHLQRLAKAGLTDLHLLPVFDLASVPETGCTTPQVPTAAPDSESQQAAVIAGAATDCFNWGYDPWHFSAPEGSFSSNPADGKARVLEFRAMVQALHQAGLRVGMDMVYNHTTASGQDPKSVLDRIVPGYYHRLNDKGEVERSTCCANTATEHAMMAKLMIDSAVVWARHYRISSMRFDLMGHQPRAAMQRLQTAVNAAAGRHIHLLGEGWNFGEVENGKRFVQASQASLGGSGIASFSDRARDAARGSGWGNADAVVRAQGFTNGLGYDRNETVLADDAKTAPAPGLNAALAQSADLVRLGLAGTLRSYRLTTANGMQKTGAELVYDNKPAGYAHQPTEVVNYTENHDNQTLFDNNVMKLPRSTSAEDRARVQHLGSALVALSQGMAYFHAGQDLLRSKSLDRNSYDSGDWFNRIDWSQQHSNFGVGLPPAQDNREHWPQMQPLLANTALAPSPQNMAWTHAAFLDLLRIRASSSLFRLRTAQQVQRHLRFHNTGPGQVSTVVVGHLSATPFANTAAAMPGVASRVANAGFSELLYAVNVDKTSHTLNLPALRGKAWALHPVHSAANAADTRAATAQLDGANGQLTVPARTAVVFVVR